MDGKNGLASAMETAWVAQCWVDGLEGDCKQPLLNKLLTAEERQPFLLTMHRRMGHPSADRTVKFFKAAGITDEAIFFQLRDLIRRCTVCRSRKRPDADPVANISIISKQFNNTLAVDVMFFEGVMILKMVCVGTRLFQGEVILRKTTVSMYTCMQAR